MTAQLATGERTVEINDKIMEPVYEGIKHLKSVLGYEPPIFQPGKTAVQSVKQTQALLMVDVLPDDRGAKTLGGTMFETNVSYQIVLSVPEKVPGKKIHEISSHFCSVLVNYYSRAFCNDVRQLYVEGVWWNPSVDELNRTEYTITLLVRYFDYPKQVEGGVTNGSAKINFS